MNKWTETLDLLQEETGSEKYKSSVLIFDENKKLLYSVENFPITLHYGSYENRVLGLTLYPQYIPLQKGKKYFFQINTNINTLHFNNNKKQIEVTYRYKSK